MRRIVRNTDRRDAALAPFSSTPSIHTRAPTRNAAEVAKRRIPGLHQVVAIDTLQVADRHQSKLAGVESAPAIRHVSVISITLYKEVGCAAARRGPLLMLRPQLRLLSTAPFREHEALRCVGCPRRF